MSLHARAEYTNTRPQRFAAIICIGTGKIFALMRMLGIKNYRFSISWSRILPEGTGKVNEKAVQMYRDMILCMKENGIRPFITLFHWEFPYELFKKAAG